MDDERRTILEMLEARRPGATLCPSEVARRLSPEMWRGRMEDVHAAAAGLAEAGRVELRQRGVRVDPGARRGAYRIARPSD